MIIPVFLFISCETLSKQAEEDANGITEHYKSLENAIFQVAISADFPERVSGYRVTYDYSKSADSTIKILEPLSVSDIVIKISAGSTILEYDGARLETGELNRAGVTPMSVLPCLVKAWADGNISEIEAVNRNGTAALLIVYRSIIDDEEIVYRTWFDRADYKPLYAELIADGECKIRCTFETIEFGKQ